MIKKNKIFSLLIHLYLIILLTPDLSGRGIARDAEIEVFKVNEIKNLNTTLLLDPKNEEAMHLLINYELKKSN